MYKIVLKKQWHEEKGVNEYLWMNDIEQRNYEMFTRKNVEALSFLDAAGKTLVLKIAIWQSYQTVITAWQSSSVFDNNNAHSFLIHRPQARARRLDDDQVRVNKSMWIDLQLIWIRRDKPSNLELICAHQLLGMGTSTPEMLLQDNKARELEKLLVPNLHLTFGGNLGFRFGLDWDMKFWLRLLMDNIFLD